jgi:short-subunit dehydrogenase
MHVHGCMHLCICTQAGHLALPCWSAYNVSKAGLDILSECLRYELAAQGIPVVLVKPGPVKTPIWGKARSKSEAVVEGMPAEAQELYGATLSKVGVRRLVAFRVMQLLLVWRWCQPNYVERQLSGCS